jgi:hypothetical protein
VGAHDAARIMRSPNQAASPGVPALNPSDSDTSLSWAEFLLKLGVTSWPLPYQVLGQSRPEVFSSMVPMFTRSTPSPDLHQVGYLSLSWVWIRGLDGARLSAGNRKRPQCFSCLLTAPTVIQPTPICRTMRVASKRSWYDLSRMNIIAGVFPLGSQPGCEADAGEKYLSWQIPMSTKKW